jgi:hypothetical protein
MIFNREIELILNFSVILMRQVIDFYKLYKLEEKSILDPDTKKFV